MIALNNIYQILTPHGWCDFTGVSRKEDTELFAVKTNLGIITASKQHIFYVDGEKTTVDELCAGDIIDHGDGVAEVQDISFERTDDVYDIIEVKNEHHQYYINNGFVTKNCDEFAFVQRTMAQDFWTAIQPTLSTGGGAIITSTPNGDDDIFADIWHGAIDNLNDKGEPLPGGVGRNGYAACEVPWHEHPERDEEWADVQRAQLGEQRFEREFNCVTSDTQVNIMLDDTQQEMTIEQLLTQMGDPYEIERTV